jgi:hypothetical protein
VITPSAASDFRVQHALTATAITGITPTTGVDRAKLDVTVASGLTAGNGARIEAVSTSATLKIDARL